MESTIKRSGFLVSACWMVFYLCVIDIAVNFIFAYPEDPRNITPSTLQQYFEYGRSTEGKFARMTRMTDDESAPIVSSGWLETKKDAFITKKSESIGKPVVTVYGMSHSNQLADDMARSDSSLAIRFLGAPGAVVTWSFTAFSLDKERFHSDVVILAVMTDGVSLIGTTSGATMFFDYSYPYTYPQYFLSYDTLVPVSPPFVSVEGFRKYFYDPNAWESYVGWLRENDKFYDPLLFRETILDKSSLFRVIRRSYANATRRGRQSKVYNDVKGFNTDADEIGLLRAIVVEFASSARRVHSVPIIYIVNNLGTSDRLFRLLEPTMTNHDIPFLSSHVICPPDNPRFYLPDSHFDPAKNRELAKEMNRLVHFQLSEISASPLIWKTN